MRRSTRPLECRLEDMNTDMGEIWGDMGRYGEVCPLECWLEEARARPPRSTARAPGGQTRA